MFNNVKNLFNEMIQVIKDTDFKKLYKSTVSNAKNGIHDLKYKIKNLFETNLKNGLMHYYSGHYSDALTRFKLMSKMWPNNYIVHYNLGKCYFTLEKIDKAKANLIKASGLKPDDKHKQLIEYTINKINNPSSITFIPRVFKEEFYNYLIHSEMSHYAIHTNHLKKLFDSYNRYLGFTVIEKGESNVSILEIGCHIGLFGKFYRQSYKDIYIEGIDISGEMIELCKDLTIDVNNQEYKIYNKTSHQEMHQFLIENCKYSFDLSKQNNTNNTSMENNTNIDYDKDPQESKIPYDIISAIGTVAEFGELSAILKLCELNLNINGMIIFIVPKSKTDDIEFSINTDCYYYTEKYIKNTIKENTTLKILDIIHQNVVYENNPQMILIAKKIHH
jgi:predicted TPR repeat methyltransferase